MAKKRGKKSSKSRAPRPRTGRAKEAGSTSRVRPATTPSPGGRGRAVSARANQARKRARVEADADAREAARRARKEKETALKRARLEEQLASLQRKEARFREVKKATKKQKGDLHQRYEALLETGNLLRKRLGLSKGDVRGYEYPDGCSIVRVRVPIKKLENVREKTLDIEEALVLPAGEMFLETNLMYLPSSVPADPKTGKKSSSLARFRGMSRIQTWGSRINARKHLYSGQSMMTMRHLADMLRSRGWGNPEEIHLRLGVTIDNSLPFYRKSPPASGTRVKTRRRKK